MRFYAFRAFFKYLTNNKLYTIVTLFGFAISLMFVMLLSVYTKEELYVDKFHANADRIYRLSRDEGAAFSPIVGEFIKNQIPEVESYTRISRTSGNLKYADNLQMKLEFLLADSTFFNIFSFPLIEGNADQVLLLKNSAVLFETFAIKLFGKEKAVGKSFSIDGKDFIVTGIAKDLPENTQFIKSDAILNFTALADLWGWPGLLTSHDNSSFGLYFLAKEGTNITAKAPLLLEQFKKDYWIYKNGFSNALWFEPLADAYFSKEPSSGIRQNSITSVYIFGGITLLILIIAMINYINLTIAHSGLRRKETAIKKILGSSKSALVWQNISESIIMCSFAAMMGLIMAFSAEPFFNEQMDCQLHLAEKFNLVFILAMLGMIAGIGLISGIIPALVVNKNNPIEMVKGKFSGKNKNRYSKILISFQYVVAVVLLIASFGIARQSAFMQNYDIGFNKENLFWMDNSIEGKQKGAFRDILKSIPGVDEVCYSRGTPLDAGNNQSFEYEGNPISFQEFQVDSSFFRVMHMDVKKTGVAYSKNGVWINRVAMKVLELGDNPQTIRFYSNDLPVLGIIENFNFRSLHTEIGPLIVRQLNEDAWPWTITLKLTGPALAETVKKIRKAQSSFTHGVPMESGFYDEKMNQWYAKETKRSKLIGAFTLLSIIISSMGIFAMSLYYIQQKIKEIGIRKVNGARVVEIITMLNYDFLVWVAVAFIIACPISWYTMQKWLQNFAYKAELSWWMFSIAGLGVLAIAIITVSWQSWRAASRNPVEALRYE